MNLYPSRDFVDASEADEVLESIARTSSALPVPACATLPAVIRPAGEDDVGRKTKEKETIRMVRTLNGLAPCTPWDSERLARYGFGREVDVTVHQERSVPHHRLYWVLLATLVANSEGKYLESTDLHEALKVALGVTRKIKLLTPSPHASVATKIKRRLAQVLMWCGGLLAKTTLAGKITDALNDSITDLTALEQDCETITLPGSTGFASMDQADFKNYFDQACTQLRLAGYPKSTKRIAECKRLMAQKVRQIGPAHQPYHSERNENVPQPQTDSESAPGQSGGDQDADHHRALSDGSPPPQGPSAPF
jgi:hypothetical protein